MLRELQTKDLDDLIELAAFNTLDPSIEDAQRMFEKSRSGYEQGTAITWVLEYKGELAGTIGFYRGFEHDCGEVGYIMKEAFKRKGLMAEALAVVVGFGFNTMQLRRITAYTSPDNLASVNLLLKCGFQRTAETKDDYAIFDLRPEQFNA